jgi:hypothetical protein
MIDPTNGIQLLDDHLSCEEQSAFLGAEDAIIVVHGTFAREAEWVRLDSPFLRRLIRNAAQKSSRRKPRNRPA